MSERSRGRVGAVLLTLAVAGGSWLAFSYRGAADIPEPSAASGPVVDDQERGAVAVRSRPSGREETEGANSAPPSAMRPDGRTMPCHDAELTAAEIQIEPLRGQPEAVSGGALVDGVYDVSSYHVFAVPLPPAIQPSFRQTIVIEAGGTVAKNVRIGVSGDVETTTWSVETSDNELNLTGVCPPGVDGAKETIEFGVRDGELVTRMEQAGVPVVVTYLRRADG